MDNLLVATAVASVACFLVCGIPFGYLIAAALSGVDVRKSGSGNIGMTNVARVAGGKAATLTFACDVGKGALGVILGRWAVAAACLGGEVAQLVHDGPFGWVSTTLFMACVLGHVFSPYLHFRGGKGIAVGLGASLGLWWPMGLGMFALFLLLAIPTRYISLGSVAAAASLPIFSVAFGIRGVALLPVAVAAAVVIWSHRQNIGRLLRGEESRFTIRHEGGDDGR